MNKCLLVTLHNKILVYFNRIIKLPFMKYYEFIEIEDWENIHIVYDNDKNSLCSRYVPLVKKRKILGRKTTIRKTRHLANNIQDKLEDSNSELTICGNCISTLF